MGNKSLTEVAKKIMMAESNDSAPDRDATKSTPNNNTLKPNSKSVDSRSANPGAKPAVDKADIVDTAPVTVPGPTKGKDTSKSSQSRAGTVPGEQSRVKTSGSKNTEKEIMEEEVMEEEFEISEELADFIAGKIEEGLSEEEIAEAIEENFEMVTEEEELDEEEEQLDETHVWYSTGDWEASSGTKHFDHLDDLVGQNYKHAAKDMKIKRPDDHIGIPKTNKKAIAYMNKHAVRLDEESLDEEEEYHVDMSEDIEALFAGEELSEDFKFKAKTIFESAVERKVKEEIERIEEAYAETLEEQVVEIQEELSSNVDDYLNYVVEQWVHDNEVAIEAGLRNELTEEFISGLRHLFAEHYIDIPEDKVHVVEELGYKVTELESKLNEEIDRNVQLSKNLNESARFEILVDICEGLTNTQAEKLKSLSEGIEFRNPEDFGQKISILKESYFTNNVNTENVLDSDSVEEGKMISEEVTGRMAVYSRALGRK